MRTLTLLRLTCVVLVLLFASGCNSMLRSATSNLADNLSSAIFNSDDLTTVERGLPAYLLLLDGLIQDNPKNPELLQTAANLNGAYASVFASNKEHAKKLASKSLDYAFSAACLTNQQACGAQLLSYDHFGQTITSFNKEQLASLYALGASWGNYIEINSDNWDAIAEIGRVQLIMERVVELDERYKSGTALIYLGTMSTLLPSASGGKPEQGRRLFERAIELSSGQNLMAKVVYARRYARLLFKRKLHDRLLEEVLSAKNEGAGLILSNTLAKKQAEELLNNADDYF